MQYLITMPVAFIKRFFAVTLLFTSQFASSQCCEVTLNMEDSYGDGWNGAMLSVFVNDALIGEYSALETGSMAFIAVCPGDLLELVYSPGDYENENSYQVFDTGFNTIFSDGPDPAIGDVFTVVVDCDAVPVPGGNPCNAIPMELDDCMIGDNSNSFQSGFNPNCSNYGSGDVWYQLVVPPSGSLTLATDSGSMNDSAIAAWLADDCTSPILVGCDDDSGEGYLSFLILNELPSGAILYVQVFGYGTGTGTFRLCANATPIVNLTISELPIVLINTLDQTIIQDEKIDCLMDIKFNGIGNTTLVSDPSNIYNGNIGIEIRGLTSAAYPQKPYGVETRTELGENNNVEILGMPAENDWVLLSNFNDRSLIRNPLAYHLFGEMGNYSPRASLCEVLVDSVYQGVYVLGERIKRDLNRVDVAKLTELDVEGDDLTGGYILQQNYWNENNSFQSNYSPIDHPGFDVHFLYYSPDAEALLPIQKEYIASYVDSLEDALYADNFTDPIEGYRKYLDVKSFIDYFLVNELARSADGFKKSVYFHKDKNSNGGKLKAGPVWDFDWAWKNLDACDIFANTDGSGWAHHINDCFTDNYSTGWYIRLLQDSAFANELRCTYETYRETMLDTEYIFDYIDSIQNLVSNAQVRHFQRWPILGISGPANEINPVATTYAGEMDTLKTWIATRLAWLDENIPGLCQPISVNDMTARAVIRCYPNPTRGTLTIEADQAIVNHAFTVYDFAGRQVLKGKINRQLNLLDTSNWPAGVYFIKLDGTQRKGWRFVKEERE